MAALLGTGLGCDGRIFDPADVGTGLDDPSAYDPSDPPTTEECEELGPDVAPTGMRRLTRDQYDNTIRDLFGDGSAPARDFRPDTVAGGYLANVDTPVDAIQLEDYLTAAEDIAERAVAAGPLDCAVEETACVHGYLADLTRRAFRRPPEPGLVDGLVALYEDARTRWDATTGLRLAVEAVLMSPHFLYLVELEPPSGDGEVVPLDDFELATRMSYFLWNTMPDEALFAAAEAGELGTPEGVEAQARRMLADEARLADAVESFHAQWLGLDDVAAVEKDPESFPEFTPEMAEAMRDESLAFVRHVFLEDGAQLEALLTASYGFVDDRLEPVLGVDAPAGAEMTRVELDPAERAGILTRPRFLAARAHQADVSWVQRGLFVRRQLLCQNLPDPPADVSMDVTQDPDRVSNPECAGCHQLMDPIGQGFDNYDAIGRFRTMDEEGVAIDGRGAVVGGALGPEEEFQGAVELAHRLAESEEVESCVARNWLRYAIARVERSEDACSVVHLEQALRESGGDMRELLVAVMTSDTFRHRRRSATEGGE